ncbi:hypothetical protein ABW19_dt0208101 [Dactylella cylindrospora]|nr:hypothetical protein ABW19_dt0208101 [Dactylella cylindrospora]
MEGLDMIEAKHFSHFRNFWELELLATHRKYRRHGAATMLINWGTKIADEEYVPCCVVSSPMGKPIYEKVGFTMVAEKPWVFQLVDEEERAESFVMVRSSKLERIQSADTDDGYLLINAVD